MASVSVRIEDFEDGIYPDVCASSGASGGARLYRDRATYRPGWVWLLILAGPAGWIGALVLSSVLQRSVAGYVPYSEDTQAMLLRRQSRAVRGAVASLAGVVASLAMAALTTDSGFRTLSTLGVVAGIVGVLLGVFLWANVPGSVGTKLESNGRWVLLDPVSPRFAAAYEEREARRRRARRQSAADAVVADDEIIGRRPGR